MRGLHEQPLSDASERWVRLCLRAQRNPAALDKARALEQTVPLDWRAIEALAQAERLAPLLYHWLHGRGMLPPGTEARWQALYLSTAASNSLAFHALEIILERLAQRGIVVILLKGAALAATVYGHLALRPMGDVDLLIRRRDVSPAFEVLGPLDYAVVKSQPSAGMMLSFENAITLRQAGPQQSELELHWSLFDSPYYQHHVSMEWFWQTARPTRIGQAEALTLGPEALILHLCGHLVLHHGGHGLLWQYDIAQALEHFALDLDWRALLERARQYDLILPLQRVIPSLASDWGVAVPPEWLAGLQAECPSDKERRVHASLLKEHASVAQRLWADLQSMPAGPARLRYALASLFPPADYMRERYQIAHPCLLPLYYPYRWLVGLRRARH